MADPSVSADGRQTVTHDPTSPRERFLSAVDRSPGGGVSLDLGHGVTSFTAGAHAALCEALHVTAPPPPITARMLSIVRPAPEIQSRCCGDLQVIAPGPPLPGNEDVDLDERTYRDEWNLTRRQTHTGLYYDFVDPPLAGCRTLDECLQQLRRPLGAAARSRGMRAHAEAVRSTGHAVGAWCFGGIFEMVFWLRGYRQAYLDFASDARLVEGLLDVLLECQVEFWTSMLHAVDGLLDVAILTEDLGTQSATMISPQQFRGLVKPRIAELIREIKRASPDTRVLLHSCGAVFPLIGDFIDMGVDILNPLQPSARGMADLARIKQEYGSDLSFHGAIDTQHLLPHGSPEEIRATVHRIVEVLGRGGGYVVAPAHCIQPDVPAESVLAMADAVKEMGSYP